MDNTDGKTKKRMDSHELAPHVPALTWQDLGISLPRDFTAWINRGNQFRGFVRKEALILLASDKERLMADCYFESSSPHGSIMEVKLRAGPDERLREEFRRCTSEAGIALDYLSEVGPLTFWLRKLVQFLFETKSEHLSVPSRPPMIEDNPQSSLLETNACEILPSLAGVITNMGEASADFSFWLAKQAHDAESLARNLIAIPNETVRGPKLNPREKNIWAVIQRGAKGLLYCRELKRAKITPLRKGIWEDCPRDYVEAYLLDERWSKRIQDEKYKITRKAKLANE
jgi:hypothetical protein